MWKFIRNRINESNTLTSSIIEQQDGRLLYHDDELVRIVNLPDTVVGSIPKLLFAFWHTPEMPPLMTANFEKIVREHPSFTCKVYDAKSARNFINQYFTDEVLCAYDTLIPIAYKSDLWRYCVLYIHGGIYIDVKFEPVNGFSFDEVKSEIYVKDRPEHFANKNGIQNTFMAVFPRNKYLLNAIKAILHNCRTHYFGSNSIYPTGPGLLSHIFPLNFTCNASFNIVDTDSNGEPCERIYYNGREILKKYTGYRGEQNSSGESYLKYYIERRIYNTVLISSSQANLL